jgi:hypothetical protein
MDPTNLGTGPDPDTKHPEVSKKKPFEGDGYSLVFKENGFEIFIDHPKN